MTLKLQHPITLIVAGPSSCGKSTFVIRLLECREQLCDIVHQNIVWCHSENNAPHHLKNVSFVKGVPDLENPENVATRMCLKNQISIDSKGHPLSKRNYSRTNFQYNIKNLTIYISPQTCHNLFSGMQMFLRNQISIDGKGRPLSKRNYSRTKI